MGLFSKAKYIKTKGRQIIVFSEAFYHSSFQHFEPVSAGFVQFSVDENGEKNLFLLRRKRIFELEV